MAVVPRAGHIGAGAHAGGGAVLRRYGAADRGDIVANGHRSRRMNGRPMTRVDARDFRLMSENVTSIARELDRFSKNLSAATLTLRTALSPYQKEISDIQKAFGSIREQLTNAFEPLQRWSIQNHDFFAKLRTAVQEWPQRHREAIITLANHGWYLDPDMPITAAFEFARTLDRGNIEEASEVLTEYFREKLDAIEDRLEERCPGRMHILREAFDAHREGKYNLSIPVFLAQADGIWWDSFSKSLFQKQDRNRATQEYVEEHQSEFFVAFFDILKEQIPLWLSETERNQSFDQLNRHLVLHGEKVDHGTEENSLRAISFLSWLCWMLDWNDEKAA